MNPPGTVQERVLHAAVEMLAAGERVAVATLIGVEGSAPFDMGAMMLVSDRGAIEGSVTGGCVEGAVFEEAHEVFDGKGPRLRTYGVSDETAATVGLMCGGTVHIFIGELTRDQLDWLTTARDAVAAGRGAALATLLDGEHAGEMMVVADERRFGSFDVTDKLDAGVARDAAACIDRGHSALRRYGSGGEVMGDSLRVFVRAFAAPAELIIFGAVDFSVGVARLAKQIGYRVTICDAREAFSASSRFQIADEVVVDWPQDFLQGRSLTPRDVVLVFTHDRKFDEPALIGALQTDVGYIGALGSRRTQTERLQRLEEAGVDEALLKRITAPCGLDIGARGPEETAVSILAEVIAHSAGRRGEPLSETQQPIHPPQETADVS